MAHESRILATSFNNHDGTPAALWAGMNSSRRIAIGSIAVLLVACGGVATSPVETDDAGSRSGSSESAVGSGSASSGSTTGSGSGSGPLVGVLDIATEGFEGGLLETFDANLQPSPPTTETNPCPGATAIVGACCGYPPIIPPPTLLGGSGSGAVNYGTNAGTLSLVDLTSSADIATFEFGSKGYAGLPAAYYAARWQPGDTLQVSASGDQIGAFAASIPALLLPKVQFPATFSASQDLTVTWVPDPNAQEMVLQLDDEDARSIPVVCIVPASAASVTIDASLFAGFKSGRPVPGGPAQLAGSLRRDAHGERAGRIVRVDGNRSQRAVTEAGRSRRPDDRPPGHAVALRGRAPTERF